MSTEMANEDAVASTSGINEQEHEQLAENPTEQSENGDPEPECKQHETAPPKPKKPINMSPGAVKLRSWLNKPLKIEMSDGRVLIGIFLCTDRDANVILGSCSEYLPEEESSGNGCSQDEPRMLGLVMVPGKHIVSVCIDQSENYASDISTPLAQDVSAEDVM